MNKLNLLILMGILTNSYHTITLDFDANNQNEMLESESEESSDFDGEVAALRAQLKSLQMENSNLKNQNDGL